MKKIALVCAYSGAANAGMLSVDFAFLSILKSLGDQTEVTFFVAEEAFEIGIGPTRIQYQLLSEPSQLSDFDLIVYWGDFLHWIHYAGRDWLIRWKRRNPSLTDEEIIDKWYRLMLLEGNPELHARTVVFGTTLYGVDSLQLADARYRDALTKLYSRAKLILMRDIRSSNLIAQLVPERPPAFGCDCALLLDSESILNALHGVEERARPPDLPERYVLCSFGRSDVQIALDAFSGHVANAMGVPKIRMAWLDESGTEGFARKLKILRGAAYVITDIYHLAVSSVRERIPVLGFGWGATHGRHTLSDKKKEIFFAQSLAASNYVYVENILESLSSDNKALNLVRAGASVLANPDANRLVFDVVRRQKEHAETAFLAALHG